ncbi:tungstate ABC transporter substrate-binding protein WtpA [Desulfobulbus rhabdoformis]|jgi:molybdate/tungstate transport system substrate-binding protein|uniref:tungstate ABC transporter substrate-binding protein WtpA n=1 Tax=Desulfobulbus rhabdoformis TaxID=34032 RepID=UPI001963B372|nr:tungstate ABC transporter substrate-binding protein WtpA [Desulfobulbus rhabdoformis]MBM9615379.1 tungstate ABC transporter substrate-binding protein WtpA [Desulfobulbus rhabdoformis]
MFTTKLSRISVVCLLSLLLAAFSAQARDKEQLIIFHAGSLSVPFKTIEQQFEAKYPNIDVLREAGGSTKMARMISELGKPADLMASADYVVINKNLIPKFADTNIRFATNQMVLCYTGKSKYADQINSKNWPEILSKSDVVWGHSDPNLDPCGYRSLMVLQLAEKYYKIDNFYAKMLKLRKKSWVRPKAVELISLLQSGEMDYVWEYLSVAVQHNLKYVPLDPMINLSDYTHNDFYKNATVEVTGNKPGTTITRKGKAITYGITLLKDAPNPEAASLFLQYLLDPQSGLAVLQSLGQPPFIPARVSSEDMKRKLPAPVQALVEVKN